MSCIHSAQNTMLVCMVIAMATAGLARAEDKKKTSEKPKPPELNLVLPLAVEMKPKAKVKIRLYGKHLNFKPKVHVVGLESKPLERADAKGGDTDLSDDAKKVLGDQKVEFEIELPEKAHADHLKISLQTEGGRSVERLIKLVPPGGIIAEKKMHDSLKDPQWLAPGTLVSGCIQDKRNVDAYGLKMKAGQTIKIEVTAATLGSPMDPMVMLFVPDRRVLQTSDDSSKGRDVEFLFKAPVDGAYSFAVMDALDRGGKGFDYLLKMSDP